MQSIITVSLVVVPTHELVSQVERVLNELLIFCGNNISVMNLADVLSGAARTISEKSRILIATPTSLKDYLARCKCLTADNLVIDEADLLFSFGYSDDLKKAFQLIDNVSQTIVISATMPQVSTMLIILHQYALGSPTVFQQVLARPCNCRNEKRDGQSV